MGKYRTDRINEQLTDEVARILRQIKDPRISGSFISVTHCTVTPDLKYAKIYYSVLEQPSRPTDHKRLRQGLTAASGYIRRELARTLNLRLTPELSFYADDSLAQGAKIHSLLQAVEPSLRAAEQRDAAEAAAAARAAENTDGERVE